MDIDAIVKVIQSGSDKEGKYMLDLYNQTVGLLFYALKSFGTFKDIDDLKQEFFVWLCDAVNFFDSSQGVKFTSFLSARLKGYIYNYYNQNNIVYVPRNRAAYLKKFEIQKRRLSDIIGREPSDKQLCSFMRISEEELKQIKRDLLCVGSVASLDKETEEGTPLADFVEDPRDIESEVVDKIDRENAYKELWRSMCDKSGLNKESIVNYYSVEYRGNKDVLRPCIYKAIKEIQRSPATMRRLECGDFNYNRHKGVRSFQNDGLSVVEDIVFKKLEREGFEHV